MSSTPKIDQVTADALRLWSDGYRLQRKTGRPVDPAKPLIPSVLADRFGWQRNWAHQVNYLLAVWSLGEVPVGQFDPFFS
jgi:hypothetical protein